MFKTVPIGRAPHLCDFCDCSKQEQEQNPEAVLHALKTYDKALRTYSEKKYLVGDTQSKSSSELESDGSAHASSSSVLNSTTSLPSESGAGQNQIDRPENNSSSTSVHSTGLSIP